GAGRCGQVPWPVGGRLLSGVRPRSGPRARRISLGAPAGAAGMRRARRAVAVNVLLTGGAGYIGTHTAVELAGAVHGVVLLDGLYNSRAEAVRRVERITRTEMPLYVGDGADRAVLDRSFTDHRIRAVVHCAGLNAVGESTERPLLYYRTNLSALMALCEAMEDHGFRRMVFSS